MRLTLRTLLAYLDDILDPEDAREIAQKIEESEFASNLMHRTRDVIRRLRLAAPGLGERGQGFDPNTVAEYLDNTLPSDRVADFEKVCLESDVQLAEVASCHQILTMVLGEPAEVASASRERMYDLPALLAAKTVESSEAAAATAPPAAGDAAASVPVTPGGDGVKQSRPKPTIPDYLREPAPQRRRLLPGLATALLLVVIVVLGLAAGGLFEPGSWLATRLGMSRGTPAAGPMADATAKSGGKSEVAAPAKAPAPKPEVAATRSDTPEPLAAKPAPVAAEVKAKPAVVAETTPPAAAKPVLPIAPAPAAPVAPTPASGAQKPAPAPVVEMPAAKADMQPAPAAATPGPEKLAPTAEPARLPTVPMADAKTPVNPLRIPGTEKAQPTPAPDAGAPKTSPSESAEAAPLPPERLGRLALDRQVLVQYDRASGIWTRMGAEAALTSAHPILSLPPYQPILVLTGVTVQLMGGTQLELLPTNPQGIPGLRIRYGRVVVRAVGEAKARLRLEVGPRVGTITLKNAESSLGIALSQTRVPGADPEKAPGSLVADLYALNGDFAWEEGDGKAPVVLAAPAVLRVDSGSPREAGVVTDPPKWAGGEEISWLDRSASSLMELEIKPNRPVSLSLRELTNHRRAEVASLAARGLGFLDEFDPMVAALNAPEQRATWDDFMRALQQAVARGPDCAAKVRQAFEQRYPNFADKLYRMLWGYTPQDLEGGHGATLVGYLDHEQLVFRVMAFYNLEKLTGLKFNYRPQDPTLKRQSAVSRWRERLQSGSLFSRPPEKTHKPERTGL
jgi:hypothetical protein